MTLSYPTPAVPLSLRAASTEPIDIFITFASLQPPAMLFDAVTIIELLTDLRMSTPFSVSDIARSRRIASYYSAISSLSCYGLHSTSLKDM
ncbi:hypothetical protein GX50_08245 [[Emmonsia] crescens]|uniref:Uncharacterized protein n=1 Tax=[Emmonsia] crescens TaxID=73230 RepID=A0A2B7Z717_9EURO|nr:hypothetical protein GX50_08245 [Emmonsia crescens]